MTKISPRNWFHEPDLQRIQWDTKFTEENKRKLSQAVTIITGRLALFRQSLEGRLFVSYLFVPLKTRPNFMI